jgi:hypothetical protein
MNLHIRILSVAALVGVFTSSACAGQDIAFGIQNPGKDPVAARNYSVPYQFAQTATPKPSSTCAKRDNACSGTCVGNDEGKSCKTSDLHMSGSCSCQ